MRTVVELDERGAIQLPDDLRAVVKPRTRFILERQGDMLILRPAGALPFWATVSAEERAEAVRRWAIQDRPQAPVLSNVAVSREHMYD